MNEDQLKAFLAVIEWGTFSAAARHLNLSQPAVSQRIITLEESINASLFERASGRNTPQLTEAGELLKLEALSTLNRWTKLRHEIHARTHLERGSVTIGGGATAVSFILPRAIAELLAQHPGLNIRVRESGSAEVVKRVLNGELDLGIITDTGDPLDPRLQAEPLLEDKIVVVVSRTHPLAPHTDSIKASDLNGERLVAYESQSVIGQVISNALIRHQVEARVWTELRSIHSILEIARLTSSIALVSELSKSLWSEMVYLKCPLEDEMTRVLKLIYLRDKPQSASSRKLSLIIKSLSPSSFLS